MDEEDKLLSHQTEIINVLSKEFEHVYVLTGRIGKTSLPNNITLKSYNWIKGKRISNSIKLVLAFFEIKKDKNIRYIFSHMTFAQSLILLPFTKIFKIKHFLWYAHKSHNIYLQLTHRLFDGIVTPTRDSCPIKTGKIFPIGHTIQADKFLIKSNTNYPITKLIHIGRFDPIKRISDIILAVQRVRNNFPSLTLDLFGSPTSNLSIKYEEEVKLKFQPAIDQGWLRFYPGVPRGEVSSLLLASHAFIHSCDAALDKVLLEASISRLPVVTINQEFLKFFGSWEVLVDFKEINLEDELRALLNVKLEELNRVLDQRYQATVDHHELNGWTHRLIKVICS
jgi:glycosyltransferase involved in cell wall biosynthesis